MRETLTTVAFLVVLLAGGAAAIGIGSPGAATATAAVPTHAAACETCPFPDCPAECPDDWVCCLDGQGNLVCCPIEDCDPAQCPVMASPCATRKPAAGQDRDCAAACCGH